MTGRFVDAHVHLWNFNNQLKDYSWLQAESDPLLGPLGEIQIPVWDAARFAAESRHRSPEKVVHVQAAGPPGDPVAETAWLAGEHQQTGWPDAIVARVDLRGDVRAEIDRHLEASPLVRGARDMTVMGSLTDPAIPGALSALSAAQFSWELACTWEEMPVAAKLAADHPDLVIVLGHAGFPAERGPGYLDRWKSGIRALAQLPNVHCKISGLGMGDHQWTLESWRPMVGECLESFSPERCLIGSNWPVDRLYASYDAVIGALLALTAELSPAECAAVRYGNAERIYRL